MVTDSTPTGACRCAYVSVRACCVLVCVCVRACVREGKKARLPQTQCTEQRKGSSMSLCVCLCMCVRVRACNGRGRGATMSACLPWSDFF